MKICFNLFPPANKLIALLIGALLIFSYTKLKAANGLNNFYNSKCVNTKNTDQHSFFISKR